MVKIPKPPKGGAKKSMPGDQPKPWLTVEKMLSDKHLYHDQMWKPGQVKTPADMVLNPAFLNQLDIIKSFADLKIDAPVFRKYDSAYTTHETYEEYMELGHDNNLMNLLECVSIATQFSDMDDPIDRGFVNLLRAIVALYQGNPYTRDRIGWFMWSVGRKIYPNCYLPLALDLYYDPRLWHRPGEPAKPPLAVPDSMAFNGAGQVFGPEDDIWSCELTDPGSGK